MGMGSSTQLEAACHLPLPALLQKAGCVEWDERIMSVSGINLSVMNPAAVTPATVKLTDECEITLRDVLEEIGMCHWAVGIRPALWWLIHHQAPATHCIFVTGTLVSTRGFDDELCAIFFHGRAHHRICELMPLSTAYADDWRFLLQRRPERGIQQPW